jgi:hypothetical protein
LIIGQLCLIRPLLLIVTVVIPDHNRPSIQLFVKGLTTNHWKVSSRDVSFVEIRNSVADSCTIIIATHSSSSSIVEPLDLKTPPTVKLPPIAAYIWEPFNQPGHPFCFKYEDAGFSKDESRRMVVSALKPAESDATSHVIIKYNVHCMGEDASILAGSANLSTSGFCSPLEVCPN